MILIWTQTFFMVMGLLAAFGFLLSEKKNRELSERATGFQIKSANARINEISIQTGQNRQKIAEIEAKIPEKEEKPAPKPQKPEEEPALELKNPIKPVKQMKKLVKAPEKPPTIDFMAVNMPFVPEDEREYTDTVIKELVHHAVNMQQLEMFVQPIQRLPAGKARYYEIFGRIRARQGAYVPANQYMDLARQENLESAIDMLILARCLKLIKSSASIERAAPFFVNISGTSLKNPAYMNRVLEFVSKYRAQASRLIFEMPKAQYDDLSPQVREVLRGLGTLGCGFSLDHVESLEFDVPALMQDKIRHIKIPAAVFDATDTAQLYKVQRALEGNGINLIAEKIESDAQAKKINEMGVAYGQGFLLGRPAPENIYRKAA